MTPRTATNLALGASGLFTLFATVSSFKAWGSIRLARIYGNSAEWISFQDYLPTDAATAIFDAAGIVAPGPGDLEELIYRMAISDSLVAASHLLIAAGLLLFLAILRWNQQGTHE